LSTYSPGLKGVIAAETRLSHIDGEHGILTIGGYSLEELAGRATYEEVLFLLWNDRLPNETELGGIQKALQESRGIPATTTAVLKEALDGGASLMDCLRIGIGTISSTGDHQVDTMRMVGAAPVIVSAAYHLSRGSDPIPPQPDLDHAANYFYMVHGREPNTAEHHALQTYLVTVIDHGLNASTFTARVIASTGSDMVSAVAGAVGALKGPLHGGAPGPALDMVLEIGQKEKAEAYLRQKFENKELLMGFGHRVYRAKDPRGVALTRALEPLYRDSKPLYDLAMHVEETALRLFEEYKPGRRIYTNVEFYTALLLHGLGLPTELFAPTFAISRVGGWTAHCFEQIEAGKIIRPSSDYAGKYGRRFIPLQRRSTSTEVINVMFSLL